MIGSDEVFNCTQPGNKVGFSRQLFGKNNNAGKVISYAASFGSTTYEKLEKYHIAEEVGELLSQFNSISVRDKNSRDIVEKLCGFSPAAHIDPVLLYNFPEVDSISIPMDNYIVVYAYADRIKGKEAEEIREFAKRENKKILSLGFYQPFCDEYVLASPMEVLAYIKHADYVITDTFHGTVFSIKYQKKFGAIIRDSNRQKLGDLLERFGVMERQICNLEEIGEIMASELDNEKVKNILFASSLTAVAGILIMLYIPYNWASFLGFTLAGAGLANMVPVTISASGRYKGNMPLSIAVSAVATIGYFGTLFGPSVMGFVSEMTNLTTAFTLIAASILVIAFLSKGFK